MAQGGQLAIIIDDFGYRRHNEEQILAMPIEISIAILPQAPLARIMEAKAAQQGRDILIHMPMAPLSKQPLEKNTLLPTMSAQEIDTLIQQAITQIPHAKGMNNHMGSAMTSDLEAMKKVMYSLENHQLFFLDSVTVKHSQVSAAAKNTRVNTLKRHVFLDDDPSYAAVQAQFNRAIQFARKTGTAVVIGHPHNATVKVLQQNLAHLPPDIQLVRVSSLVSTHSLPIIQTIKIVELEHITIEYCQRGVLPVIKEWPFFQFTEPTDKYLLAPTAQQVN